MTEFNNNANDIVIKNTARGIITTAEIEQINTTIEEMSSEKIFDKREALGSEILQTLRETIGEKSSDGVDNYDYLIAQQCVNNLVFTPNALIGSQADSAIVMVKMNKDALNKTISDIKERYVPETPKNEKKGLLNFLKLRK